MIYDGDSQENKEQIKQATALEIKQNNIIR